MHPTCAIKPIEGERRSDESIKSNEIVICLSETKTHTHTLMKTQTHTQRVRSYTHRAVIITYSIAIPSMFRRTNFQLQDRTCRVCMCVVSHMITSFFLLIFLVNGVAQMRTKLYTAPAS